MKDWASHLQKNTWKELFVLRNSWNKYKNLSSSDLTEECVSLQSIFLNHFSIKPIYCGSYLVY